MRKPQVRAAAVVAVLVVIVAAVTAGSALARSHKTAATQINVADLPLWHGAPAQIALEKGYFTAEGLEVKISYIAAPSVAIAGLASGAYDIYGTCGPTTAAVANIGGVGMKFIAPAGGTAPGVQASIVLSSSSIKSRKDLQGKTIAINSIGGSAQQLAMQFIRNSGVDPKNNTWVAIPSTGMQQALETGRVDAALAFPQPQLGVALATGNFRRLGDDQLANGPYGTISSGWCASNKFLDANPDAAKGFVRAMLKANKYARTHKQEAKAELTKYTALTREQALRTPVGTWSSAIQLKRGQFQLDSAFKSSLLAQPFTFKSIVWSGAPTVNT
jgi:NitT/TauT family transport system substrate-binding protein